MNNNNIINRIGVSPTKESVAVLYSPHEHYFSMIINKLQKIPLQHSNKRTKKSYKQTKPTPMKTVPILKLQMMKNCILLFLLLLAGSSNAQIVNIPDANFKAKLLAADTTNGIAKDLSGNYFKIDSNNDGEIQVSEALAVGSLDVFNSNISSMVGIESFTNLQSLSCFKNQLLALNVLSLTQLQSLNCTSNNSLTTLNVSGLSNLTNLRCGNSDIDFPNATGNLSSLNVNGCVNLLELACYNNQLTSLDLTGLTQLQFLQCGNNQLTSLVLTGIVNISEFGCYNNQLTSLDLTGINHISYFSCSNNNLANINFSTTDIGSVYCSNNFLTTLDLSNQHNLTGLNCNNNQLISLDLSYSSALQFLSCSNNLLETLFIKNGAFETDGLPGTINNNFDFSNNPNLHFICADDFQIVDVQNRINQYGYANCQVSSYCSFTPGGTYNTITGSQLFDSNNNGCDVNDFPFPNIKVRINDGTTEGASFTNATGNYTFYTQAGSFTVAPEVENPSFFNFSPTTAVVTFPDNNNNISTNNFCITANGIHNDLEVVLSPIVRARPGFDAVYKLVFKNKGNQSLSSWTGAHLNYDATKMSFVSASMLVSTTTLGQLVIGYSLNPFETQVVQITFHINAPTDSVPVNIGDVLPFNATITSIATDDNPSDNSFTYNQIVVGAYDPNDIQCLEGSTVLPTEIGKYLHYAVQFENTGTAAAENVVVKDVIDTTKYDMDSLQLLDASAPVYARITGNVVEFIFKNIQLSPATGNPPVGGHGDILFKIKSKNTLVTGNTVEKQAKIYFDYNAPINTNIAQTTFAELSNTVFTKDDSITVSPNPTHALITINGNSAIKSITLFDVQGRILETVLNNNTIDLADKTNGIYFLKITSEKGSKVEKVVKE